MRKKFCEMDFQAFKNFFSEPFLSFLVYNFQFQIFHQVMGPGAIR